MGMFSDYKALKNQTKEMSKRSDVTGSLATMHTKLAALNTSLAATTTGRAISAGHACTATVTSVRQTGAIINFELACDIELLLLLPGRPPIAVTRTEVVPQLYMARALPGNTVAVRVTIDDPNDVYIDWAAS